jgi:hypothetical protein
MDSPQNGWSSVPARRDTVEHIKSLKRGGESYDELLRKMADSYREDLEP